MKYEKSIVKMIIDNNVEETPKYDLSTEEDILVFPEVADSRLKVFIVEVLTQEGKKPGMASYINDYDNMLDYYIRECTDVLDFTPNVFHVIEGFSGHFTEDYYGEIDTTVDFKNIRLATYDEYAGYEGDYGIE